MDEEKKLQSSFMEECEPGILDVEDFQNFRILDLNFTRTALRNWVGLIQGQIRQRYG